MKIGFRNVDEIINVKKHELIVLTGATKLEKNICVLSMINNLVKQKIVPLTFDTNITDEQVEILKKIKRNNKLIIINSYTNINVKEKRKLNKITKIINAPIVIVTEAKKELVDYFNNILLLNKDENKFEVYAYQKRKKDIKLIELQ